MKKIAALYNPYLDTMGGGERHSLAILKVLEDARYEVWIFWNDDVRKSIEDRFHMEFKNIVMKPSLLSFSQQEKWQLLKKVDILITISDGSYFFHPVKQHLVLAMIPDKKLYPHTLIGKLKTTRTRFLANSRFTQDYLNKHGTRSMVLYPYIQDDFFQDSDEKQNNILSVGRFFESPLHTKNHEQIIKTFITLKNKGAIPTNMNLLLAGGASEKDNKYVEHIQAYAKGHDDIRLVLNPSFVELLRLYKASKYFWHFTGFGVDELAHPEKVEHFGITPLEAMAAECIPFVVNAGGPKEYIKQGKNGFLFSTTHELSAAMQQVQTVDDAAMRKAARIAASSFSYEHFKKNVSTLLSL